MEFFKFIAEHGQDVISALVAVLSAAIAVSLLIPGDQPEKSLQKIVDFIQKISKK